VTGSPFERAVVGGLVLLIHAANRGGLPTEELHFSAQEIGAAKRAIAPFLDETFADPDDGVR
jgi:hypothetical protein